MAISNFANLPITSSRHAPIGASVALIAQSFSSYRKASIFGVLSTLLRQDLTSDNSSQANQTAKGRSCGLLMHV